MSHSDKLDSEHSAEGIQPSAFRRTPATGEGIAAADERIEAVDYRSARNSPPPGDHRGKRTVPANAFWILAAVLLALALGVFVYLPSVVQQRAGQTPAATAQGSSAPATATTSSPTPGTAGSPASGAGNTDLTPWQSAQILKAKQDAEKLTEDFVRSQLELEDRRVDLWASAEFAEATELAQAGDGAFSQRDYESASRSYQAGIEILTALQARIQSEVDTTLQRGNNALADYDSESARQAFELALAIEPGLAAAVQGLARSVSLDELASLRETAREAEDRGDLVAARDALAKARTLDPQDELVKKELAGIDARLGQLRFSERMSLGYAELAVGNTNAAQAAFADAARLRPNSKEVDEALAQVESSRKLTRIANLQQKALEQEAAELWADAAGTYAMALELDSTLVFARQGRQRSTERAELDGRLRGYIEQPERLQSDSVYQAAEQVLQIAGQVEPQTPILQRQLRELQRLLVLSRQPVAVTFQSDNATVVTLQKVGRLGSFEEKQVDLRPGDYVAVGQRKGYRDVRKSFRVPAGEPALSVLVVCEEAI